MLVCSCYPRRVLAQTAKTRGGTLGAPVYREENFAVPEKILIFENTARKGLPKSTQRIAESLRGLNKHAKDSGSRVSATRLFCSCGHFVMAYAYGYSELYSAADKECSESQKGRSDFSSVFSVSVVQTLENETGFDINFTCKGRSERSKDQYSWLDTTKSMHIYI